MHTVQLEHNNSILSIENTLIGERLKGLNDAVVHLLGLHGLQSKYSQEFLHTFEAVIKLAEYTQNCMEHIESITQERDLFQLNATQAMMLRDLAMKERNKLYNLYKDKTTRLKTELQDALTESEAYRRKHVDLEKSHSILGEEFANLRNKLNQFSIRKKVVSSDKICKRCKKLYNEFLNFNWSCRTHQSDYSGEIWWCCGKPDKDDKGCITAKHENKSDEEEDIENTYSMSRDNKPNKIRCSNCKETGHRPHECPRDPNARSHFEPEEELERLLSTLKISKKFGPKSLEITHKLVQHLMKHFPDSGFVYDSSASESGYPDEIRSFNDILDLKKNLDFSESFNHIEINYPDTPNQDLKLRDTISITHSRSSSDTICHIRPRNLAVKIEELHLAKLQTAKVSESAII